MESEKTASSLFRLSAYQSRHEHALIGIMSGTSFDGIDAVLVRIITDERGHIASLAMEGHYSLPYSQELQKRLLALCSPETARIDELVYAHAALAEWYAGAVEGLLGMAGRKAQDVYAICLHGQTVWHAPVPRAFPGPSGQPVAARGTLQIGSAPLLHERTGIPVIYDFRSRDMAAGGEGAPLAPFVDALLFGSLERGRIVQNIGGIGNATVIPAGAGNEAVFAFDTGPGNMVMDELAKRFSNGALAYDKDGLLAARGRVSHELLEPLLEDPYFSRKPPKSTGREVYGAEFAARFAVRGRALGLSDADIIATATAFTAETIVRAYRDFVFPLVPIDDVIVGGGGALNPSLMAMIRERLPAHATLRTTADYGIPVLAREAIAFAVLGHEALMGHPSNLPVVTGASHEVILGSLTL